MQLNEILHLFAILLCGLFLSGCGKSTIVLSSNPEVDAFVSALKSGQYQSHTLPVFTEKDIPALLIYRNERQDITNFPRNPISSLWMPTCKLGMYVLWTIESIRATAVGSKTFVMGFPSQNPVLAIRESFELKIIVDDNSHAVAAQAYFDWWAGNSNNSFSGFKNTDPLQNTTYKWH